MGLLDDAIREHLELKRRHGADPAEVAAQEQEVLGAGRSATPAAASDDDLLDQPEPVEAQAPPVEEAPPVPEGDDPFADLGPAPPAPAAEHGGAVSIDRFAPAADDDIDWSDPAPLGDPEPQAAAEPEAEDVLEETPEFLEETPEHDRLWFEQRPPKDFDF